MAERKVERVGYDMDDTLIDRGIFTRLGGAIKGRFSTPKLIGDLPPFC